MVKVNLLYQFLIDAKFGKSWHIKRADNLLRISSPGGGMTMNKTRGLLAAASIAGFSALASASANASVYTIDIACLGCGTGPYGTVTATDIAGGLQIDIGLASTITFHTNQNNNQHAIAFDLVGNPTISLVGPLPSGFSLVSTSAGSIAAPPFTNGAGNSNFEYAINYTGNSGLVSSLVFELAGLTTASLQSQTYNCNIICVGTQNIFFALDLSNVDGTQTFTGNVAATATPAVPEASTWAMMLLGFAGVGFLAYRRRGQDQALRLV